MPNIDERVVQMTFDNKQFESGVSESLKTLDDLKKALNFDEVEGSLKNIENAFNNLDLSGLADSVDFIASRFEPLGKIADKALDAIADKALDVGRKITDAFFGFSDMSAGQSKYETRTKAVQTIMNATGKSIEEVEAVLDSLQKYTDETSYDFAAMVDNIGKFTSVGVDLALAEKAMEGIGNEAAKSGASIQQANHAMYNFAQALSQGAVKLQDWKSISNATMATKEFKEMLISTAIEMGTLKSAGENVGSLVSTNEKQLAAGQKALAKAQKVTKDRAEKVAEAQAKIAAATKETEVNFQNFESTLSDGWLTSDVLIKTLNKYSDMETKFGQEAYYAAQKALTFTDAIQATKDAVSSGWMDSFGYIFGNLEEAMELWTNVANALYEYVAIFSDWRNQILESWHTMGGYNDMIEAASNLWQTFMNIVRGVGDALMTVFPILKPENMTQALLDGTKALKEWSAELLDMFGLYQKVEEEEDETAENAEEVKDKIEEVKESTDAAAESMDKLSEGSKETAKSVRGIEDGLKRGMRGDNVKALQKKLVSLGFRLDKFGVDGIFGPETQGAVEELQRALGVEVTGALDEATLAALNTEEGMAKLQERMHKGLSSGDVGKDVKDIQNELNKFLGENDKIAADGVFGPKTKAAVEKLQKALGVEVTGSWDEATRAAFESRKMTLFSFDKIRKEIRSGSISKDVKALQEELIKTGYLTDQSVADGIYGPKTEEAVRKLQRELGVEETGVWDEATYRAAVRAKRLEKANAEGAKAAEEAVETANEVGGGTKEAGKTAEEAANRTTVAMMRLQNIVKGWAAALKIVTKFTASVVKIGSNILGMFQPLIDVFYRFGSVFGVMFQNLAKELDETNAYDSFVEKVTNAFGPFGKLIESIANGLDGFLDAYDAFLEATGKENTFGSFFEFLKGWVESNPVLSTIANVFSAAGNVIGSVISTLGEWFSKLIEWFSSDTFKQGKDNVFAWITEQAENVKSGFGNVVEWLGDKIEIFKSWFSSDTFKQGKDNVLGWIADKLSKLSTAVTEFSQKHPELTIENFVNKIKELGLWLKTKLGFSGTDDGTTFLDDLKTKFEGLEPIITWMEGIRDKLVSLWQSIFGTSIEGSEGSSKSNAENFADDSPIVQSMETVEKRLSLFDKTVNWILDIKNKLVSALKGILTTGEGKEGPSTALDKLKDFCNFILDHWFEVALGAAGIAAGYGLVNAISIAKNFSKAFEDIGSALKDKLGKDEKKDTFGTTALKIAGALLIVAGAVGLLSLIDADKAWKGIIQFVIVLGALTTAIILVNKLGGENGDGAKQALMLAGSIGIIAVSMWLLCKTLNSYSTGVILSAMGIVILMAVMLGAIAVKLTKQEGKGVELKGFLSMCAGVFVLVLAFERLIKIINKNINSPGIMIAAFVIIEMLLWTLGGIAKKIAKNNVAGEGSAKGYLSLCAGVFVLVLAFEKLIKILKKNISSPGIVIAAFAILELMLLTLGHIAKNVAKSGMLGNSSADGYLALCAGIYPLVIAFERLISIIKKNADNPGVIVGAFAILELMLLTLGHIAKNMAKTGMSGLQGSIGLLAVAAALFVIVETFGRLVDVVSKNKFENVAAAFGGLLILMNSISRIGKSVGNSMKSIKSIIGFLIIGATVAGLMYVFANALEKTKGISSDAMLAFATGLSEIFLAVSIAGGIAGKLGAGNTFLGIIAVAGGITAVIAALSGILAIPGVEQFLSGGMEKIGRLIGNMIGAMKAAEFETFNKAIANMESVSPVDQSKVDNAIAAAQAVANFGAGLPEKSIINTIVDKIFGSELSQFSNDMIAFGNGFNGFVTQIMTIGGASDDEIQTRTSTAISVAEAIRDFSNSLPEKSALETIVDRIFGSELSQFSNDMIAFGTGFNGFTTQIMSISNYSSEEIQTRTSTAISVAEAIRDFGNSLPEKSALETIVDRIFGSELSQFSNDMIAFGTGFNGFTTQIMSISNYSSEEIQTRTSTAISVAEAIRDFGNSLPEKSALETITDRLFGSELSQFSNDMTEFGTGFNGFVTQIMSIDSSYTSEEIQTRTGLAIGIATAINNFGSTLEDKSIPEKIVDKFFGSELNQFSSDMTTFATKFNEYASAMGSITTTKTVIEAETDTAITVATKIAEFLESLGGMSIETKAQGIKAWFSDETKGETVIDSVADLADAMTKSSTSFTGLADAGIEKDVEAAVSALNSVAGFLDMLSSPDVDLSSGTYDNKDYLIDKLQIVLNGLHRIAQELVGFNNETKDLPLDDIAAVSRMVSDFLQFGLTGADFNADNILSGIDFETVSARITEIAGYVQTAISQSDSTFNTSGASITTSILAGLKEKTSDFTTAGENFVKGLTNGVYFQTRFAVEAAAYVARQMVTAVKNTFQTASPSKVMTQVGRYFSEGLGIGVSEEGENAVNSSRDVAERMMKATQDALAPVANGLLDDIDDQPVIRPVVDLTDVESAKDRMSGYFGGQTERVSVSTKLANHVAGEFERQRANGRAGFKNVDTSDRGRGSTHGGPLGLTSGYDNSDIIESINAKFEKIVKSMSGMQVVLDTGELVGATSDKYDKQFGTIAGRRGRGN